MNGPSTSVLQSDFDRDELMYESSSAKLGVIKLSKELEEKKLELQLVEQKKEEYDRKM